MPEPAAGLTIRYEDSATDRTRDGHDIVKNHGFHHHTTHDQSEEIIDVYQPFELTDENEALIEDLQKGLTDRFPEESVELKYTGRKDRGDQVSVRYLLVIGQKKTIRRLRTLRKGLMTIENNIQANILNVLNAVLVI